MSDPRSDPDDMEYYETCWNCDGSGTITVCVDDLCRGQDYCMHGDGDAICPVCHGSGER